MLPTIFEFRWDAGHMIFFGVFYTVIAVMVTSLIFITAKSVTDVYRTLNGDGTAIPPDISKENSQSSAGSEKP